jgi:serine protease inhibitor
MRVLMSLIAAASVALTASTAWVGGAGAKDTAETAAAQPTPPLDPAYLNKVQSSLGFRLIARMSRHPKGDGNLLVSPSSLAAVLALLDLGANADMRAALLKALGFEQDPDAAVSDKLASLRASAKSAQVDTGGALTLASAIVFDRKVAPHPDMVPQLAEAGAQVTVEDLENPATIQRINAWVKERTAGLIPTIIDKAPN